ncbi:MAG: 30S ribosomal protein S6 [Bacteroidales bacterium]|nr:30S ribosomal protein S6 [Bacteroidales bacterium]
MSIFATLFGRRTSFKVCKTLFINKKQQTMVNQYETVFIATPVLSDAQMKEAVAKYVKLITDNGGEIVYQEDWGLRQLAYPIQHKTTGFYYLIEFRADSQFVATLETQYHRDERIIRFLTVALDKDAVAYAEKRRANKNAAAAAPAAAPAAEEAPAAE